MMQMEMEMEMEMDGEYGCKLCIKGDSVDAL